MALGELSSSHPGAGSFGLYADLYLNPWAGFISRAGYWVAISVSVGANLVASATYMRYWFPTIPALVWVALFSLVLIVINLRSVGDYGRFEFWFAMVKLATMALFIVIGGALLTDGRVAAQYTAQGGFFPKGTLAPLLAMTFALYTFGGIEMVAITTGESRSAAEIPRAVKLTFITLAVVYLGAIVVLVGVMPWNRVGVTESPFVTVFRTVGIPAASSLMSFVILTAALSGANANLYSASRMLFSLARGGWAPAATGTVEYSRIATVRSGGVFLRDHRGSRSGNVGSRKRLRVHSQRRIVWPDALLAGITRRTCCLSAADEFGPGEGTCHALAGRRMGIDSRTCARYCCHSENLVGLARQPDQRRFRVVDPHRCVCVSKTKRRGDAKNLVAFFGDTCACPNALRTPRPRSAGFGSTIFP